VIGICGIEWGPPHQRLQPADEARRERPEPAFASAMAILRIGTDRPSCGARSRASSSCSRASPTTSLISALDLDGVPAFNAASIHRAHHSARQDHDLWRYRQEARRRGTVGAMRPGARAQPVPDRGALHRVLGPATKPGGFSARGGVETKLRCSRSKRSRRSHAQPVRLIRESEAMSSVTRRRRLLKG